MNNPETNPQEWNYLDNKTAQEEANMIRSAMKQHPYSGDVPTSEPQNEHDVSMMEHYPLYREGEPFSRKTTPEDYDRALEAVEELRQLAEREPDVLKALFKIARVANKSIEGVSYVLSILFVDIPKNIIDGQAGAIPKEKAINHEEMMHRFEDVAFKLNELKKQAEKLAQEFKDEEAKKI